MRLEMANHAPLLFVWIRDADGSLSIQEVNRTDYDVTVYFYDSTANTMTSDKFGNSADIYETLEQRDITWAMVAHSENNNPIALFTKQDGQLFLNNSLPGFYGVTVQMTDENGNPLSDPVFDSDGEPVINPFNGQQLQSPRMEQSSSYRLPCPTQGRR